VAHRELVHAAVDRDGGELDVVLHGAEHVVERGAQHGLRGVGHRGRKERVREAAERPARRQIHDVDGNVALEGHDGHEGGAADRPRHVHGPQGGARVRGDVGTVPRGHVRERQAQRHGAQEAAALVEAVEAEEVRVEVDDREQHQQHEVRGLGEGRHEVHDRNEHGAAQQNEDQRHVGRHELEVDLLAVDRGHRGPAG